MMEQINLTAVAALLDQEKDRLKGFRKGTYADSFASYMEENEDLWNSFRNLFAQEKEPVQAEEEVANCLADRAQDIVKAQKNRIGRDEKLLNINLYMVSYVFPALLACQEEPKEDNSACRMADAISRKWKETFPKHTICYADFDAIQNGFKQKLCYVTTAICRGLHKQQDCREVVLMKRYRDEYLIKQEGGEEIVREYYDIAPTIVKRIEKEEVPEEKYQYLWDHYLKFCVAMVEAGRYGDCREKYEEMVKELKREYFVTNQREEMQ